QSFAENASLKGVRIGVVRELMQPFTKADEEVIRITNQAIEDLKQAGATIVDPGPDGALFKDAIAAMLPGLDSPMITSIYKEAFPAGTPVVDRLVDMTGDPSRLPPELTLRILAERDVASPGEGLYLLNRYLRERGDKKIKTVADLIANSTFYNHATIDGVTA